MSRLWGLAAAAAVGLVAVPALGADTFLPHDPVFRPAYDLKWHDSYEDSLSFELGLRYWYSRGWGEVVHPSGLTASMEDTTHSLEAHFRIDDWSTATYARGHMGYSVAIDGQYGSPAITYSDGRLAYARADLGYNLYQSDDALVSLFAGYGYTNQEADGTGLDIHALRLGVSARAGMGNAFDIYGEVAALPYAWTTAYRNFEGDGALYGYSAELLAGFEPGPNVLLRGGVRAEHLTGPLTIAGEELTAELFRWGPLIELTYAF